MSVISMFTRDGAVVAPEQQTGGRLACDPVPFNHLLRVVAQGLEPRTSGM